MRKPLLDVQETDRYLLNQLNASDRFLFEAKMILQPDLRKNLLFHRKVHSLIRLLGRRQKKQQLQSIHDRLMLDKEFNRQITSLFA